MFTRARVPALLIGLALVLNCLAGCSSGPSTNPAFPLTLHEARAEVDWMRRHPKSVERPIVIIGGFLDRGVVSGGMAKNLRALTSEDAPIITVSVVRTRTFDECRDHVIQAVQRAWPCDEPGVTTEVDVVGHSMGGLVGRYAAVESEDEGRRLRINRLFTIATPHRGARTAGVLTLDQRIWDMRGGSNFLKQLDAAYQAAPYPICPYGRQGDAIVGVQNTAPPWMEPWWVSGQSFEPSHLASAADPRILADIARRLRGEMAYIIDPAPSVAGGAETGP